MQRTSVYIPRCIHIQSQFSSVQSLSHVWLFDDPMNRSTPSLSVHHQLPEFTHTHVHWVSDAIKNISSSVIPLSSCPQSFPASGSFQMSQLFDQVAMYWSFSFNNSPSNERPGLVSFRMDWLDLLAVQETLKSLLQHHSSKALILWRSAFFTV